MHNKRQTTTTNRLHHHRAPNVNPLLEYAQATRAHRTKSEWIKGH